MILRAVPVSRSPYLRFFHNIVRNDIVTITLMHDSTFSTSGNGIYRDITRLTEVPSNLIPLLPVLNINYYGLYSFWGRGRDYHHQQ